MRDPARAISVLVAVLLAGGALAFDPGGWQVFLPAKWLVITVCAFGAAAAALFEGVDLHRRSLHGWAAFLAWAAVTSLIADDPLAAWLGTPDRRFGFVALLTLAAAFVGGQAITDEKGRVLLSRAAIVALGGMTLYGIAESLGTVPVDLTTTTTRLGATFGSPAYLGAALCLLLPMGVGTAADRRQPLRWRIAGATAAVCGIGLLAGSGARAAAFGLGVTALLAVLRGFDALRRHPLVATGVVLVVVASIALSPLGGRLGEPISGRLAEWRVASRALVSDPLTGTGLEGYRVVFPSHVDVAYVQEYGRTTITDRAHSGPLDLGVAMGVPGTLAWVAAAVWLAIRCSGVVRGGTPVLAGMGAGVFALLTQELFLFPTLEVGAAGWAIAGVVVASARSQPPLHGRTKIGAAATAALALLAATAGVIDVVADHRAASAVTNDDLVAADSAFALRPDSFRYALLAADVALQRGDQDGARDRVEAAAALSPPDPAVRIARARLAVAGADTSAALALLEEAVEADPNHPELRILLGDVQAAAGKVGEAERSWLAAAHLSPADPTPHLRLAALYLAAGEADLARASLQTARRLDPDHAAIADLEDALR